MSSYFLLHGQRFSLSTFTVPAKIVPPGHGQNEVWLVYLRAGLLVVEDDRGFWSVSPGQVAFFPPGCRYEIEACGCISGVAVSLAPGLCVGLPEISCAMTVSGFVPMILERAVTWQQKGGAGIFQPLDPRQERLLQVLLDELHTGSQELGRLLLPKGKMLNDIAREILNNPGERKGIEEWASCMDISSRSISRHFSRETGMTFAQWRQVASLLVARKRLAQGENVQHVSQSVGYENVSAFIASFQRVYGITPAQFRQMFD